MRVPRGLFLSDKMTAALSSKRMWEPSGRPYSLCVRTTTALTTSPFLTAELGTASLTEQTITSPTVATDLLPPATTRMHISWRAPVLSATLSLVNGRIMAVYSSSVSATPRLTSDSDHFSASAAARGRAGVGGSTDGSVIGAPADGS